MPEINNGGEISMDESYQMVLAAIRAENQAEEDRIQAELSRKDAALQAYCDAYDAGTGTIHVNKQVRAALSPIQGEGDDDRR